MDNQKLKSLILTATQIRKDVLDMIYSANSGNMGSALSSVEIITLLYFDVMKIRPNEPRWEDRDRLVLSKGHAAPAYYSAMAHKGYFDPKLLTTFRKFNSLLQTHPEFGKMPCIDFTSGSLGMGLSGALGMVLAWRYKNKRNRVFVYLGDGEIQEGQVWEAAMACGHFKASEIIAFVDYNHMQGDGRVEDIMTLDPLADKWKSFGWSVQVVDGHSFNELSEAITKADKQREKPNMIITNTTKGKGISFMENSQRWHLGAGMTQEEYSRAKSELEAIEKKYR